MRLTLRTLLAYMDDILDPADQEELGRKIESSPFATELIHRSRDAVRRLRLSAPDPLAGDDDDIHGGDHNLDANTAAEYLDNTLSPEGVADFERSCLEAGPNADMLLAEAASCHHVLTMVLGEPAEVDADLRQRMYALEQSPAAAQQVRIEPAHTARPAQQPPVAAAAASPPAARQVAAVDADEAGVPDYILAAARERRRTRRNLAAVVGVALVAAGLTYFLWPSPAQTPKEVAGLGTREEIIQGPTVGEAEGPAITGSTGADVAAVEPGGAESEAPPFNANAATATPTDPAAPELDAPPLEMAPAETPAAEETEDAQVAAPGSEPGTSAIVGTLPGDAESTGAAPLPVEPGVSEVPAPATPPSVDGTPPTDAATDTAAPAEASAPAPVEATAAAAATPSPGPGIPGVDSAAVDPETPPTGELPGAAPAPMADADAAAAPAETPAGVEATAAAPAEPKAIGAYLGNNDVLLQFDPGASAWIRVPPRTAFTGGEQLLSLPTFRTHVVLADVNAYLSGGAHIELIEPGQSGEQPAADFALHIPYGRVIFNSGLNGNRIELSLVDQTRVVELGPSSSLAVEVRRIFVPSNLAKREPAPAEINWYLTSGTAKWGDSGSAEAPATWTTAGGEDSVPAAIEELPEWVDREPISDIERRARERVAEALVPGEPVNVRLLELSDPADRGRRTEDRALAARSGAYVGMYDALVTALGDVNQRAAWREQIEALRQAIARDPAAIEGIRAAFVLERGAEAAEDLMEMLLGFDRAAIGTSRQEVQQGAMLRLLRWMDDDDLVYRVLAWHNVNQILGTRDLGGFKPEQSASQRKRMLDRIWERFERGELLPPEVRPNE